MPEAARAASGKRNPTAGCPAASAIKSLYDLTATGGKFYMAKEAVNLRVSGKPAISKIFTDEDGRSIEEVVWVNGRKFYMLTYSPDPVTATKHNGRTRIDARSIAGQIQ